MTSTQKQRKSTYVQVGAQVVQILWDGPALEVAESNLKMIQFRRQIEVNGRGLCFVNIWALQPPTTSIRHAYMGYEQYRTRKRLGILRI